MAGATAISGPSAAGLTCRAAAAHHPGSGAPCAPQRAGRRGPDALARNAAAAPGFQAQLPAVVHGSMGGAALWKVFQGGANSEDPQQCVLAYRALRLCAAASPPYNAYAPPLVERPAWLSGAATLQADLARSEMLRRGAPFAVIRPDERTRLERELGSALDGPARQPARATESASEPGLVDERTRLRDAFARFGPAALVWAGADLVHYTEQLANRAASGAATRSSLIVRVSQSVAELALCELGASCDTDSNAALSLCYATGQCTGGLRDRLLADCASESERERAMLQARQLAAALRSGNLVRYGL